MSAKFTLSRSEVDLVGHFEGVAKTRLLEVAKNVYDGIVMRMPVRTGSARASWTASVGAPDLTTVTHNDPNSPLPAPSFPLISATVPTYAKIYISNGKKYIMPLEYGWSKQAPHGMVRVTLASLGVGLSVRR